MSRGVVREKIEELLHQALRQARERGELKADPMPSITLDAPKRPEWGDLASTVAMALAETIGKSEAHHLIEAASRKAIESKTHLRDVLAGDTRVAKHLSANDLKRLFDPMGYQGVSQTLIDRLLASLEQP